MDDHLKATTNDQVGKNSQIIKELNSKCVASHQSGNGKNVLHKPHRW
jgi:hypothetical protein